MFGNLLEINQKNEKIKISILISYTQELFVTKIEKGK